MLAAILVGLLLYFGLHHSSAVTPQLDQAAALIKKDVADETRRKQALAIVDQMKATAKTYAEKSEKSAEALAKLTAKRETPVSELERAAQPLVAEDRAAAEKMLDLRFELKSVLTASEWSKVFPAAAAPPEGKKNS